MRCDESQTRTDGSHVFERTEWYGAFNGVVGEVFEEENKSIPNPRCVATGLPCNPYLERRHYVFCSGGGSLCLKLIRGTKGFASTGAK